jgi:hypothetical protein
MTLTPQVFISKLSIDQSLNQFFLYSIYRNDLGRLVMQP